jgi:uncharacterized paraquat-inducible protein A
MKALTAKKLGYLACSSCGLLCQSAAASEIGNNIAPHCPRCHASLHSRKPHSIGLTWAFCWRAICCIFQPICYRLWKRAPSKKRKSTPS